MKKLSVENQKVILGGAKKRKSRCSACGKVIKVGFIGKFFGVDAEAKFMDHKANRYIIDPKHRSAKLVNSDY